MNNKLSFLTAGAVMLSLTFNIEASLGASVIVDADGGTKIDLQGAGISITNGNVSIGGNNGGHQSKTNSKSKVSVHDNVQSKNEVKGNITNKVVTKNRTEIAIGPNSQAVAGGVSISNGKVTMDKGTSDSGVEKVEQRHLGIYHALEIKKFPGDVVLRAGKKDGVTVTADGSIISAVSTTVHNETLLIDLTEDISTSMPLNIEIGTENISSIVVSGVADVVIENITKDSLRLEISGSGSITAKGNVKNLDALITGSGDLKLSDLQTERCSVKVNGQGDAVVNVIGTLTAEVNGSGDIVYFGNPTSISKSINGLGDIKQAED